MRMPLTATFSPAPDGNVWTERANPKALILRGVAYNGSLLVAVGSTDATDAYIITSSNGA